MLISQTINREFHKIGNPMFMDSVRNNFPDYADSLFFMHNTVNGCGGVCGWVNQDQGVFVSLYGREGLHENFSRDDMNELTKVMRPQTTYWGAAGARRRQDEEAAMDAHEIDELTRKGRDIKRHLYHNSSAATQADRWFDEVR
jgi:hypothetical protein